MPRYNPQTGRWEPGFDPNWRNDAGLDDSPLGSPGGARTGSGLWDRDFSYFPLEGPEFLPGGGPNPTLPSVPGEGLRNAVDALRRQRGGGGGGGGFDTSGLSRGPTYNIPDAPQFSAPQFSAPTLEEAMASPGYQFRLGEGQRALEQSAAARGLLRTGGTLKDILAYGQNFASQEYANVYDRALSAYDRRYQAARDEFTPRFAAWQTLVPVEQRRGDLAFQREWDMYTFPRELQQERDLAVLNAGLGAF